VAGDIGTFSGGDPLDQPRREESRPRIRRGRTIRLWLAGQQLVDFGDAAASRETSDGRRAFSRHRQRRRLRAVERGESYIGVCQGQRDDQAFAKSPRPGRTVSTGIYDDRVRALREDTKIGASLLRAGRDDDREGQDGTRLLPIGSRFGGRRNARSEDELLIVEQNTVSSLQLRASHRRTEKAPSPVGHAKKNRGFNPVAGMDTNATDLREVDVQGLYVSGKLAEHEDGEPGARFHGKAFEGMMIERFSR
jgi:hypothetical protein